MFAKCNVIVLRPVIFAGPLEYILSYSCQCRYQCRYTNVCSKLTYSLETGVRPQYSSVAVVAVLMWVSNSNKHGTARHKQKGYN